MGWSRWLLVFPFSRIACSFALLFSPIFLCKFMYHIHPLPSLQCFEVTVASYSLHDDRI